MFMDWEGRPALLTEDGGAYAIVDGSGDNWVEVSRFEVIDSGKPVSEILFGKLFPEVKCASIPVPPL